MGASPKILL